MVKFADLPCKPGREERLGSGRCALSLVAGRSMGSYDGAWRRSLRLAMVARADLRWLKQQFPTDRDMRISHEAIYRSLFLFRRAAC